MSRMIVFIALAFLAASASAQTLNFYENSNFCNSTKFDGGMNVTASGDLALAATCTNYTVFGTTLFVKSACNSTTGIVTVWQFNDVNCATLNTTLSAANNQCTKVDDGHSFSAAGCPAVAPATGSTSSSSSSSSTGGANPPAGSSSSSSSSAGAATPAPSSSGPQGGDATRAAFSLFAAAAVIVSALL